MTNNSNDNVIPFPKERIVSPPQTMEEVAEHMDYFRMVHIQDSLEMLVPTLFNQISVIGFTSFPEDDPVVERLGAMIIEAIRAYLCYHHEIPHCFQDMATSMFACDSEGELSLDGSLQVVFRKRNLQFRQLPRNAVVRRRKRKMPWMKFNNGILERCTSDMINEIFLHEDVIWIQSYENKIYVDGNFTSEELRLLADYIDKKEKK